MRARQMAVSVSLALALPAVHAGVIYQEGNKYVELGGRIQLQYHHSDPDNDPTTDELFFRRLRPYIEGSVHENWRGRFQWDMGGAEGANEISIKDAYFQFLGLDNMTLALGNKFIPFSREQLTSSKKQQLVERTFVGDHNYGTPDRQLGLHLESRTEGRTLTWAASASHAGLDRNNSRIDFETLANDDGFNQGWLGAARVDYHPFGYLPFAQGDFNDGRKATIGVAAYTWSNDDDNNAGDGTDVETVTGYELSGAWRGAGVSVDAEFNTFDSDLVGNVPGISGLYRNGKTTLENASVEGGYMVLPRRVEVVAGYQTQDADGYATSWNRLSAGVNYFVEEHDIKYQFTYRAGENVDGVGNADENEIFLQGQYVF